LLATVGLALLVALGIVATLSVAHTADRGSALSTRGITTTARLVDSHYDPGGGDPAGWTTDHVSFTDRDGQVIRATVGHHDDDLVEKAAGSMTIVYDPLHPTDAAPTSSGLVSNDSSNIPTLIGAGLTAVLAIALLFGLMSIFQITRISSV
jgi:hypothetical protein